MVSRNGNVRQVLVATCPFSTMPSIGSVLALFVVKDFQSQRLLVPIANKYHEGKMKRTLERELKVPEIAKREANETSSFLRDCCRLW